MQRRELIAYVTLVLGITDYVVFEDPGYSAKNTDRPEYQAMMDRIRTGEFTHLDRPHQPQSDRLRRHAR